MLTSDELWVMPDVELGDIVIHHSGSDSKQGYPAIVTMRGDRAISLMVFIDGVTRSLPVTGVRHRDDPLRRSDDPAGFWVARKDYLDRIKAERKKMLDSRAGQPLATR